MKKKITIGLFIDAFFPMIDGVAMVVDNYAKRLVKYANVIVFAPSYEGKNFDDSVFNYKVVRCKSMDVSFLDYSLPRPKADNKFKKALDEANLDIVHIHSPATLGMAGINYAKKHGIPVIGTMHSQYKLDFKRAVKFNFITNFLTKRITKIYEKCDEVWTVNDEVARIFTSDYGYKGKPRVVYNATEMKPLSDKKKACDRINDLHDLSSKEMVFLFDVRINKLKYIYVIVDALKILDNNGFDFKMFFVGSGQDEDELKNYISLNGLDDKIILCGRVTDRTLLASYYARADLFLFPSLYDCNAIVQLEAASQKTPTLFLKGAATTSLVKNNVNGFLADNDSEKYAEKIIYIMNNKKLYDFVCDNAYRDLYKNWDDVTEDVYNLYLDFINGKEN
ncbi:MAG: glycosyltransferase [Bacilli bacterium]|nr:glycosyltransferase [Bacilli bacterium]